MKKKDQFLNFLPMMVKGSAGPLKLGLFPLMLILCFCSKKTDPPGPEPDRIALNKSGYQGGDRSESLELELSSNGDWQMNNAASWCGASPASGQGNRKVLITFADNNEFQPRAAQLVFSCGEALATFDLKQNGRKAASNPTFAVSVSQPFGLSVNPFDLEIGDGNKDGIVDVFLADQSANLSVAYNYGTVNLPSFGLPTPLITYYGFRKFCLTDLEGDGLRDVAGVTASGSIVYYRAVQNSGSLPFYTSIGGLLPFTSVKDLALCDIDGDEDQDLVMTTVQGTILFCRNNGSKKFAEFGKVETWIFQNLAFANSIALVDIENDNDFDIVVSDTQNNLGLIKNIGTKTAFQFQTWEMGVLGMNVKMQSFCFGDIDGDLDDDLLGTKPGNESTIILQKNLCF